MSRTKIKKKRKLQKKLIERTYSSETSAESEGEFDEYQIQSVIPRLNSFGDENTPNHNKIEDFKREKIQTRTAHQEKDRKAEFKRKLNENFGNLEISNRFNNKNYLNKIEQNLNLQNKEFEDKNNFEESNLLGAKKTSLDEKIFSSGNKFRDDFRNKNENIFGHEENKNNERDFVRDFRSKTWTRQKGNFDLNPFSMTDIQKFSKIIFL